ncbi:glucan 1,3-beta-glucosidase [Biscogniauxia mediterranea]|nr:glucan 1,3-beta-glucosidase [Biscogniauxia mediterranea]
MRFSTICAAAAATGPIVASAAGSLGFALGNKKSDGSCKDQDDYVADFKAISSNTDSKIVRIYAASDCDVAANILPKAKAAGFTVILGIWPDTDESFEADKAAVVEYAPKYKDTVHAITVGSESMYRGNFTGEELLTKIKDVKSAVGSDFKVGTADSWNKYADGTADALIKGGVDILLCNAFSYWQGQLVSNATGSFYDDIYQAFGHIQEQAGGTDKVELWVGETGWPTAGDKYQNAEPGVDTAKTFFSEAVCGMVDWGFNVFFFEAFDEKWKPVAIGEDGSVADETSWGAMTTDRKPKYTLKC